MTLEKDSLMTALQKNRVIISAILHTMIPPNTLMSGRQNAVSVLTVDQKLMLPI